ncbi:hypothetical protein 1 [Beihai picorna-like virus 83]|uniref:hypothetical protein 1 n=1 Tax=Beihai picorna-like virus 83 TaxID=1922631 RepID=UPI000909469B|nr:hypothetical protein 1 [Beihai picorna-like virus 83]APG76903.1 hypothetical protein 1 [Beihai picorna-like virus 83]
MATNNGNSYSAHQAQAQKNDNSLYPCCKRKCVFRPRFPPGTSCSVCGLVFCVCGCKYPAPKTNHVNCNCIMCDPKKFQTHDFNFPTPKDDWKKIHVTYTRPSPLPSLATVDYCCDLKCFEKKGFEVDGLACRKCRSFSRCMCACRTYMGKQKFCCDQKCSVVGNGTEMIPCYQCKIFGICKCVCKNFVGKQAAPTPVPIFERVRPSAPTPIFERVRPSAPVPERTRKVDYCCERKCFEKKGFEVDGMACRKCRSFNRCMCACKTYMDEQNFCCNRKCFVVRSGLDEVDGMACLTCKAYGLCMCDCDTYMIDVMGLRLQGNFKDDRIKKLTKKVEKTERKWKNHIQRELEKEKARREKMRKQQNAIKKQMKMQGGFSDLFSLPSTVTGACEKISGAATKVESVFDQVSSFFVEAMEKLGVAFDAHLIASHLLGLIRSIQHGHKLDWILHTTAIARAIDFSGDKDAFSDFYEGIREASPEDAFFLQGSTEVEAVFGPVLTAVTSFFVFLTVPRMNPKAIIDYVGSIGKVCQSWRAITEAFGKIKMWCVRKYYKYMLGIDYDSFKIRELLPDYPKMRALVDVLEDPKCPKNIAASKKNVAVAVIKAYESCLDMLSHGKELEALGIDPTPFSKTFKSLETHYQKAIRSPVLKCKIRKEPFVVHFASNAGGGKSTMVDKIVSAYYDKFVDKAQWEKEDCAVDRCAVNKYWEGYHQQPVLIYDDFGQVKDQPGCPNPEFFELIRIANNRPFHLNMAEVDAKSNSYFGSDFVIANANATRPRVASLQCPDALYRRFNLAFTVKPRKEYTATNAAGEPILDYKKVINEAKAKKLVFLDNIMECSFYDMRSGQTLSVGELKRQYGYEFTGFTDSDTVMPETTMIELIMHAIEQHNERQEEIMHLRNVQAGFDETFGKKIIDCVADNFTSQTLTEEEGDHFEDCSEASDDTDTIDLSDVTMFEIDPDGPWPCFEEILADVDERIAEENATIVKDDEDEFQLTKKIVRTDSFFKDKLSGLKDKMQKYLTRIKDICGVVASKAYSFFKILVDGAFKIIPFLIPLGGMALAAFGLYGIWSKPSMCSFYTSKEYNPYMCDCVDQQGPCYYFDQNEDDDEPHEYGTPAFKYHMAIKTYERTPKGTLPHWKAMKLLAVISNGYKRQMYEIKTQMPAKMNHQQYEIRSASVGKNFVKKEVTDKDSKYFQLQNRLYVDNRLAAKPGDYVYSTQWMTVMRKNAAIISSTKNNKTCKMSCVYLTGTTVLVPGHFPDGKITISDAYNPDFEYVFEEHQYKRTMANECGITTDLSLITFPPEMSPKPNIISKIMEEKDENSIYNARMVLSTFDFLGEKTVVHDHHLSVNKYVRQPIPVDGTIIHKHFTYMAPTVVGNCGGLAWITGVNVPGRIAGMHVAGSGSVGCAVVLNQSLIRKMLAHHVQKHSLTTRHVIDAQIPYFVKQGIENINGDGITCEIINEVPAVGGGGETKLRPSLIAGTLQDPFCAPAMLKPRNGVDPMEQGLKKILGKQKKIDEKLLRIAVNSTIRSFVKKELHVLSYEEGVSGKEGEPFIRGINRRTSPGFPYVYDNPGKGKTHWFGNDEYIYNEEIRKDVEELIENAKKGIRKDVCFIATLKDERRPWEKVLAGKTRVFEAGPQHLTIATRMYFLDLLNHLMKTRIDNEMGLGTNVYSIDWDTTARKLLKFPNHFAGDFSNFDGSQSQQLLWAALDVIEAVYQGKDEMTEIENTEDRRIREVLFSCLCSADVVVHDKIIRQNHGQPSGNPITTLINCLMNKIGFRLVFLLLKQERGMPLVCDFEDYVSLQCFGDDNIVGVSSEISEWFNQITVSEQFSVIGFTYTDESKNGAQEPFRPFSELEYLKRKFVISDKGYFQGPMRLKDVMEITNWTKNGWFDEKTATIMNAEVALFELALHGKAIYNDCKAKLVKAIEQLGPLPKEFKALTWEEQMELHDNQLFHPVMTFY